MKNYKLSIPDALCAQIEEAYKNGKLSVLFPSQFMKHLITMGLKEYREEGIPQAADCGSVHEEGRPGWRARIIPFPDMRPVVPEAAPQGDIQTTIDDFLKEIGYIE